MDLVVFVFKLKNAGWPGENWGNEGGVVLLSSRGARIALVPPAKPSLYNFFNPKRRFLLSSPVGSFFHRRGKENERGIKAQRDRRLTLAP